MTDYFWFGGSPGARKPDVYLEDPASGDRLVNTPATIRDAATGAVLSDFLDANGQPTTQVTSDANGYLTFAAPVSYVYVDAGAGTWAFYSDGAVADAIAALPQLDDIQASASASAFSAKQAQNAAEAAVAGATAPTNTAIDTHLGGDATGLVPNVAGKVAKGSLVLNVRDYGATGNGTTDDTAALQAALDASANAGGRVYLPSGIYKSGPLLLASNVTLAGNNGGAQAGGPTRLVYAGAAGGTFLAPKAPTTDTVNIGLAGLTIDCAGVGSVGLSLYRVSYSRFADVLVTGMAAGGTGIVVDANVNNQAYFNRFDNCKVSGGIGVTFQNGANVNTWSGGKIGNGTTCMQFLSASQGNVVISADLETASVQHVYVDAPENVFVGNHLESAPVGFTITANGTFTRHSGTTLATNVTTWFNDASANGLSMDRDSVTDATLRLDTTRIHSSVNTSQVAVDIDPKPINGTSTVLLRFFRQLTTTGIRQFLIHKGDGTGNVALFVDAGKANVGIGAADLTAGGGQGCITIGNRAANPTANPSSGGVLYVEAGALKFRGSAGTTTIIAPA